MTINLNLCWIIFLLPSVRASGQTPGSGNSTSGMAHIWISIPPHIEEKNQAPMWRGIREDGGEMFDPAAPWKKVAGQTSVVKLNFVDRATDTALQHAFSDLKRRHIALALETSILIRSDKCASTSEAYGRPGDLKGKLEKIKRNGGDLQYIAMDEPFYFGHEDSGPTACHQSAEDIARAIAENLKMVRSIFPQVKVGDIEVTDASRLWMDELVNWVDTYRTVVGEPLAFLHADVVWSDLAMRDLAPLAGKLKQRGVPFGIIYTADADARTDDAWAQSAINHFLEIESGLRIHPDDVIFQSWSLNPVQMLPENKPATLTNIAFQYIQPATTLALMKDGNSITGRLTDSHGKPVPHAPVLIDAVDAGARMGLTGRHLAATVPGNAATAVIGIRANAEGSCVCAGEAGASVGGIRYREQGTGRQEDVSPVTLPISGAPPGIRTFKLTPDKKYAPNLQQFPVTPGRPFTFDAPIMATATADHAGYVTIVFLDSAGKGVARYNLWFTPSRQRLDSVITDGEGRFRLQPGQTVMAAHPEIRAFYPGNPDLRPSMALLTVSSGDEDATMPALVKFKPGLTKSGEGSPLVYLYPLHDFTQLFNNDAAWNGGEKTWSNAARHVQIISFSTQFLSAVSDTVLSKIVRYLKQEHMGIGLESLATNWFHEPPCGGGIEGYSDPGSANRIVSKLLKAGGSLDYIAMDEPLWFGHYYNGKNACKSSIQNLAERVAVIIKTYTAAFPNVIVGDIEPFPAVSSQAGWQADYATWVKAFNSATGTPLGFLRLDFNWGDPRLNKRGSQNIPDPAAIGNLARSAASVARANGLQVAMIYNGTGGPNTDAQWIQQARTHIDCVEASGIHPDQVIFQSWDKYPARSLPETDPDALTSLINYYFQHYK